MILSLSKMAISKSMATKMIFQAMGWRRIAQWKTLFLWKPLWKSPAHRLGLHVQGLEE